MIAIKLSSVAFFLSSYFLSRKVLLIRRLSILGTMVQ